MYIKYNGISYYMESTRCSHRYEKEIKLDTTNKNICGECDGIKVITPEGLPVCSSCGLVEDRFIDESPEWTSGVSEDGKVNDPSRCGNPNSNPELFSQAWGKGTIMATTYSSKYEIKRMAKINFHMSMNHKDRSLFHAYKGIDEACHTLPDSILKDAKMMYKKFDDGKLTRVLYVQVSRVIVYYMRVDWRRCRGLRKKLPTCLEFKGRISVVQHRFSKKLLWGRRRRTI